MYASRKSALLPLLAPAVLTALIVGCGGSSSAPLSGGALKVVAAENFWGSIAKQLAGSRGQVQSIVVDPAADPHAYQPTAADARTLATSELAIVNGVGYDPWAPELLAANPSSGRTVLTVGDLFGVKQGDNPHRWYSPPNVERVANTITADLKTLHPADRAYFDQQRELFETRGLAHYHALISDIKARYSGAAVGASESIFALLAPSLGLSLITPPGYMNAISEGTEPTAADKLTVDRQINGRQIKVWVYNPQNSTPDIARLTSGAKAQRIPIATVTETLSPASDTFEQWQAAQLQQLAQALHEATGK